MITIGIQMGGPTAADTLMKKPLLVTAQTASRVRDPDYDDGTEAWLNPVYIVPGSIHKPEFDGYRVGNFSRKNKGLVIVISVPVAVAAGANIESFIVESLREAVRIAARYFTSKGISFSTLKAEKIILAIDAALERSDVKKDCYP